MKNPSFKWTWFIICLGGIKWCACGLLWIHRSIFSGLRTQGNNNTLYFIHFWLRDTITMKIYHTVRFVIPRFGLKSPKLSRFWLYWQWPKFDLFYLKLFILHARGYIFTIHTETNPRWRCLWKMRVVHIDCVVCLL